VAEPWNRTGEPITRMRRQKVVTRTWGKFETDPRSQARNELVAHERTKQSPSDWPDFLPSPTRHPSFSMSTMLSILARSSPRHLPPPTVILRSFSSSAATQQAVPTESKALNKEFKIYRWVRHVCSFRLASTSSPSSFCRIQMNLRKVLNYSPTLLI
jgi:hypothetical protein